MKTQEHPTYLEAKTLQKDNHRENQRQKGKTYTYT